MGGLRVVTKTERGRRALQQHLMERKRQSWAQRRLFDQFYVEVIEERPFGVRLEHRSRSMEELVPFESMRAVVLKAMVENNARVGVDFEVVRL